MIDPLKEQLHRLGEARRFFPRRRKNKYPDLSTLHRWIRQGCRGIKLEAVRVGGSRVTSREAVARFIERLSCLDEAAEPIRSPAARQRANRKIEAELDQMRI